MPSSTSVGSRSSSETIFRYSSSLSATSLHCPSVIATRVLHLGGRCSASQRNRIVISNVTHRIALRCEPGGPTGSTCHFEPVPGNAGSLSRNLWHDSTFGAQVTVTTRRLDYRPGTRL